MTTRSILHLRLHRPPFTVYGELFTVLDGITPVVQALPPDSAVLDVTGALGYFGRTPEGLADLLATRLLARYGLHAAIGTAGTRLLAAMAADVCHLGRIHSLDADPVAAQAFLRSRPVEALPGVGPALTRSFNRYGVTTVGDLADLPLPTVRRIAGAGTGRLLHDRAHGIDPRAVVPGGPPAGITSSQRFAADVLDPDQVRRALLGRADDIGTRLRGGRKTARVIELQITYADRSSTIRSRTLREPSAHTPALADALYSLYAALGLQRARIRAVTVRVGQLAEAQAGYTQLSLDRATEDARRLEPVIDKANHRWGTGTLAPAALAAGTAATRRALPRAERVS